MPLGGRKAFSSLVLSEAELEEVCACAEILTTKMSIKATAKIVARKMKRDERVNQVIVVCLTYGPRPFLRQRDKLFFDRIDRVF